MDNSIAIVGMAGRLPSANNMEEFWEILSQGIDAVVPRPKDRPRMTRAGQQKIATAPPIEAGFLKCHVDEFDEKFFGVSPREAVFMDPQQRLLLEVAWESLENAGINPLKLRGSQASVFVGIWMQDYAEIIPLALSQENMHHRYTGNAFSATTSKISYFLGLHGPNLAVESGCSSSMSALHLACESLQHGKTSLALCGGVNIILDEVAPFGYVLSKDQRSKTFDESADGFARAEACGMVVLKRYADAVKDGNNILAIVRGSAMNNDGAGTSFGTPNSAAQELVIRSALMNAGIKPSEVNFIEAHGTGTAVGDPTEVGVLGNIYSEGRNAENTAWLSSVKSNMGHAEAAAGIAGLLKVLLCLKNKSIPPHLHLKTLNPHIRLDSIPAKIPKELTKWEGTGRIAALSSFSMSGTNVHVIIQEAPEEFELLDQISTEPQVLKISAKSEAALEVYRSQYVEFAKKNPHANIRDIAYGMNVERASFPYRIALTATNMEEFGSKLEAREFQHGKAVEHKIAFLFPGQGSQYFGMAENLFKNVPTFKSAWDLCSSNFESLLGVSLSDVVWGETRYLEDTRFCQPAIFCLQVALTSMWNSFGIFPDLVLGHSAGEIAAAVAAGILNFEDALKLVVGRSELVSKLEDGAMLAVKVDEMKVWKLIDDFENEYCGEWVDIAAINSSNEVVVSGYKDTISNFKHFCEVRDQRVQKIDSSTAFHSRAMDPCLNDYGRIAETITQNIPQTKVAFISGTRAMEMTSEEFGPEYWKDHLRKPVQFSAAAKRMSTYGCDVFLEIGPQPTLTALAMMELSSKKEDRGRKLFCPSMRKKEDNLKTLTMTLVKLFVAGAEINWINWFVSKKRHVELPFYPFQRSKFWCKLNSAGGVRSLSLNLHSPLLHPLLGGQVRAPGNIFCHMNMNINDPSLAYLQDHKVGDKTILPGAAYLEIILSAAKQLGISGTLKIENFSIEAPLNLELDVSLYTVVSQKCPETGTYNLEIQRELDDGDVAGGKSWKLQAKGRFGKSYGVFGGFVKNLEEIKIQLSAWDELGVAEVYNLMFNSGIQFGPEFKRIRHFWAGEEELLAEIEVPTNETGEYHCHPVVLDAMIQTFAFMKFNPKTGDEADEKHIHLPVAIQKFTWLFPQKMTTTVYAHSSWNNGLREKNIVIVLYNSDGEIIGLMEGPEFIQTSVATFLRHLNAPQGTNLPQMWEAVWKPRGNCDRMPVDLLKLQMPSISTSIVDNLRRTTAWEKDRIMAAFDISDIFIHVLLRTASELNWGLELGATIKISNIRKTVSPLIQKLKALEFWMELLVSERYLKEIPNSDGAEYGVILDIPEIAECNRNINRIINEVTLRCKPGDACVPYAKRVAEKFSDVLRGRIEPLELLFPNDELEVGASTLYNECFAYQLCRSYGVCAILDCVKSHPNPGVFRILEVGGGTGATTKQLLQEFVELNLDVEYTFTDISPQFLSGGKTEFARFQGTSVSLDYNVFNIEEDPLGQGFHPEQFDLVVAFSVLHATRDLQETLTNLKTVLRPHGILIFLDQFYEANFISFSFGLLSGWWRARDFRKSPVISAAEWETSLQQAGFCDVSTIDELKAFSGVVFGRVPEPIWPSQQFLNENTQMPMWLLLDDNSGVCKSLAHKLEVHGRKIILVEQKVNFPNLFKLGRNLGVQNVIQFDSKGIIRFESLFEYMHNNSIDLEGIIYFSTATDIARDGMDVDNVVPSVLLHLCQGYQAYVQRSSIRKATRLFGITSGVHYVDEGRGPGNPNNSSTWSLLTSFLNENLELRVSLLDFDEDDAGEDNLRVAQIMSKLWAKNNECFTHITGRREFNLRLNKYSNQRLGLNLAGLKQRFEVNLPDSNSIQNLQIRTMETAIGPGEGEVEVEIKATSLNFRDLFMIFRPEGFRLPLSNPEGYGSDISGVIRATGSGTSYKPGDEVMSLQHYGGFKSHLVLPAAEVVRKPEHMTFAEAASIPCAFISAYASLVNKAGVMATDRVLIHVASGGLGHACIQIAKDVGAKIFATAGSKRKRAYLKGLGISYVYNSRSTEFGDRIMKDTDGEGVTVVINSLTTPGFKETSLRICANEASFIELGKVNVWSDAEVSSRRPDVKYALVDVSAYSVPQLASLWDKLLPKFENGTFKAIKYTQYPMTHLREALHYFKGASHIGKVVIKMPELSSGVERNVWRQKNFNEKSTYLITGGLGGLGLEVTKWMLSSGAENVVLVGRSQPTSEAQNLIDSLNTAGANIRVFHLDVSDYTAVANMLKIIDEELSPLRGIFHTAGTVKDDMMSNQTCETFAEVFRPKVTGAWNLHHLTLGCPLDFFVSFSSSAAVSAITGQSNYAAANLYLDSLINYRRAIGLPGLTINWGPWSEVGLASKLALGQEGNFGLTPFNPIRGISALEYIMENHIHQVMVQDISDFNQLKAVAPLGGNFYDEVKEEGTTEEKKEQSEKHTQLLQAIHSSSSAEHAAPLIKNYIETILKETLGMKKDEKIDPDQNWVELGVDSLMALEMRNRLQSSLLQQGRVLTVMALQENNTMGKLAAVVGELLSYVDGVEQVQTSGAGIRSQ